MRRALAVLAVVSILVLVTATPAVANSDPHRFYYENPPVTLEAGTYCAFPVLIEWPISREYATETDLPDGTIVLTIRGAAFLQVTNEDTSKSIMVNGSGPGTVSISPDGKVTADLLGRSALSAPNLVADFGLPSNFVALAGPVHFNADGPVVSSLTWKAVLLDICAALS